MTMPEFKPLDPPADKGPVELQPPYTQEQALQLINHTLPQGKIIGVTNRPSLGYKDGIYITVANPDKPITHIKVD